MLYFANRCNYYSCSNNSPTCEGGIITWLPERDTIQPSDLSSTTWKNSDTNPYSYDRGNYEPGGYKNGHGKSGNYYNWTAAIASNNSSSYNSGNAANSICPKGWRLPNINNYEFSKLLYAYGVTKDDKNTGEYAAGGSSKIIAGPLYFIKSYAISNGGYTSGGGVYLSSTAVNPTYDGLLYFHNSIIYPAGYGIMSGYGIYKSAGVSARCLAE